MLRFSTIAFACLSLLAGTSISALAEPAAIQHRALRCWPNDAFPIVSLSLSPARDVRSVRIYYRAIQHTGYFFTDTVPRSDGSMEAAMPMASKDTKDVVYFIEAINSAFEIARVAETTVPVMEGTNCSDEQAALFAEDDPRIVVRAIDPGAPRVPPGFSASGLVGSEGSSKGLLIGLSAAAAGAAVGLGVMASSGSDGSSGGDPSAPGTPPGSGDPGPGTGGTGGGGGGGGGGGSGGTTTTPPSTTTAPATTTVPATTTTPIRADMSITITGNPASVPVGGIVTFTVNVTNHGPDPATNVVSTVRSSLATTLTSAHGSCSGLIGNRVQCHLGVMTPGETRSLSIVMVPTVPGVLTTSAEVVANEVDPNPANNSDSTNTTVTLLQRSPDDDNASLLVAPSVPLQGDPVVATPGSRMTRSVRRFRPPFRRPRTRTLLDSSPPVVGPGG